MGSQYRVIVANRIEEFRAKNSRFINYCYLLEKGPFWGKTEVLYDTAITFTRRTVKRTILERGRMPANLRGFTIHSTSGKFIRNGICFQKGDISASRTGDAFITILRAGCHYYSLSVSDNFAKRVLTKAEWGVYSKVNADQRSVLIKHSSEFPAIVAMIDDTLDGLANGSITDSDNDAIRSIQQRLLQQITTMIEGANIDTLRSNSNHRLLFKACKVVMDTRLKSLSVEDLAKRIGTSRRNLEHIFQSLVGFPPKQFIQNVRLNRIREDLLNLHSLSVMGITKRYGINHLGHFSGTYKSLFGELPSETRARARALEKV